MTRIIIQDARPGDAPVLAELFCLAAEELAAYLWAKDATPSETVRDVGIRRFRAETGSFSYHNCKVALRGQRVLGMSQSFAIPTDFDVVPDADPVLQPFLELLDPGSLYLSSLAVFPDHRRRGLGTRLLGATIMKAQSLGLDRITLICFAHNHLALRLYDRLGFVEVDRRELVGHPSLPKLQGQALRLARTVNAMLPADMLG